MYDIRAALSEDDRVFATRPEGIDAGTTCGQFLADQTAAYMIDVGFDAIMFFANDSKGELVPRDVIDSFALRFWK